MPGARTMESLPDLGESIARFEYSGGTAALADSGGLEFVLRVRAPTGFQRSDFLCRAYPLGPEREVLGPAASSWSWSPHFNALYAYLPASAGTSLVALTPFRLDALFDSLVLALQPWRHGGTDVVVDCCLLRRETHPGSGVVAYLPLDRLRDA